MTLPESLKYNQPVRKVGTGTSKSSKQIQNSNNSCLSKSTSIQKWSRKLDNNESEKDLQTLPCWGMQKKNYV